MLVATTRCSDHEGKGDDEVFHTLTKSIGGAGETLQADIKNIEVQTQVEVSHKIAEIRSQIAAGNQPDEVESKAEIAEIIRLGHERIRDLISGAKASVSAAFVNVEHRMLHPPPPPPKDPNAPEEIPELEVGSSTGLAKDGIRSCLKYGMKNCPIISHAEAPISAHPYCACEPRIQQQEIRFTQWPHYHFNKYAALRKCHGDLCGECLKVLSAVFYDLSSDTPGNEHVWCRGQFHVDDESCVGLVQGFRIISEGIKFEVASVLRASAAGMAEALSRDEKLLKAGIASGIESSCRRMDCCNT